MRKNFDFSMLDSQLTGPAINEDFFDDFSGSIVHKDSAKEVAGESVMTYSCELVVTVRIRQSLSLRNSIASIAEKIDIIFNNCRVIDAASVLKCRAQHTRHKNVEIREWSYDEFPEDKDLLRQYAKEGSDLGDILPDITLMFIVSYEPTEGISYKMFVNSWEKMMDNLGNRLPFCHAESRSSGGQADMMSLTLYVDDDDVHRVNLRPFGQTTPIEYAAAYKMLYNNEIQEIDIDTNVAAETYKSHFDARKLIDKVRQRIATDAVCPIEVTYKTSAWIADKTLLVKLNMEPLRYDVIDVSFVYMILRNYFFNMIPDVMRKNYAIGVAVTSEAGFYEENNKYAKFGTAPGPIQQPTHSDIANMARVDNIPMLNDGKDYKTNRFVDIRYDKNDARCYVLIPSRNGYLTRNWEKLEFKYPNIMKDAQPFLETKLD